jgi:hypothetical protein
MGDAFEIATDKGRRDTLRTVLVSASIDVTSALLGAEQLGLAPVADSPYQSRLIAVRVGEKESSGLPLPAAALGFEIVRSVIPDEALQHLLVADILTFRAETRDIYAAWEADLDQLAATLEEGDLAERARRLLAIELAPKMRAYRAELASARDSLFGDIMKSATDLKLPTLAVAVLHHNPLMALAVSALGNATAAIIKGVTDNWKARRAIVRKYGVAYLVKLADQAPE